MDKFDPCKYKMVKDIEKPVGIIITSRSELLCKILQKSDHSFWVGK